MLNYNDAEDAIDNIAPQLTNFTLDQQSNAKMIVNKIFARLCLDHCISYYEEQIEVYSKKLNYNAILDRFIDGKCLDWGEYNERLKNNFLEEFIYTENSKNEAEAFYYVKRAADKGYAPAYKSLADRYAEGIGCLEDWETAFLYWNLSVQNNEEGYAMLGDCYRLGKGTDKNYDKAWDAYEKALEHKENEFYDEPPVRELLLIVDKDDDLHKLREGVEIDWIKYAVKKQSRPIPSRLYREIASIFCTYKSDEYYYWIKLGDEASDIRVKCDLFDITEDLDERKKLIKDIFKSVQVIPGGDDEYDYEAIKTLAKNVIENKEYEEYEEHAIQFLLALDELDGGHEEIDYLSKYYEKQNRSDFFGDILSDIHMNNI